MSEHHSQPKSSFHDDFESPDFYKIDDLLTEEHLLVRSAMRDFVKQEITPYIEDWAQNSIFPGLYILWPDHAGN
jgi:glutaryl-CoA dehydrogenase